MKPGASRQTAYKVWIGELLKGEYKKETGEMGLVYVDVKGQKVSRVNLIANVIDKFEGNNYHSLELDDSSGSIKIKVWGEDIPLIEGINVGDMVLFIGRIKEYSNERYLSPEITKKLNNLKWLELRNKELIQYRGKIERETKEELINEEPKKLLVEEQTVSSTELNRQRVLALIEKKEEVEIEDLIKEVSISEEELNKVIKELLKEGEIFEPRPGHLRII